MVAIPVASATVFWSKVLFNRSLPNNPFTSHHIENTIVNKHQRANTWDTPSRVTHPHRIHGIGIFTYGFHVGQYPIPMDPMGSVPGSSILQATRGSLVFRASNWTLRSSFSWKFFSRRDGWIPMKKSQEMRRDVYVCIYINKKILYMYIYIYTFCFLTYMEWFVDVCCLLHLQKKQQNFKRVNS